MKEYAQEQVQIERLNTVQCDVCKRTDDAESLELHSYLSIDDVGGFGSVFGDMNTIELDMCQYCMMDLLGSYIRVSESAE